MKLITFTAVSGEPPPAPSRTPDDDGRTPSVEIGRPTKGLLIGAATVVGVASLLMYRGHKLHQAEQRRLEDKDFRNLLNGWGMAGFRG